MARKRARFKFKKNFHFEEIQMGDTKQGGVWKKERRLRKKLLKRCSKLQFQVKLDAMMDSLGEEVNCNLPESVYEPNCDHSLLLHLGNFVNRYLTASEDIQPGNCLESFYLETSYLTLHVAPYLCRSEDTNSISKKSKLKSEPLWSTYERLASNLLPGGLPLPSWAWAQLCPYLKRSTDLERLGKEERQQLKALRVFQAGHIQRLSQLIEANAFLSSDDDRATFSQPNWRPARGQQEIARLLSQLPRLIHIKNDECSRLDIIISQPTVVFFRYSCLAAEPTLGAKVSGLATKQLLTVQSVGQFLIRIVQRSMLVTRHDWRILQEDLSIMPATADMLHTYGHLVTSAVTEPRPSVPLATSQSEQQQLLVAQLSQITGMNPVYSRQCLVEHGFSLAAALVAFEQVKTANLLPAEAFLP